MQQRTEKTLEEKLGANEAERTAALFGLSSESIDEIASSIELAKGQTTQAQNNGSLADYFFNPSGPVSYNGPIYANVSDTYSSSPSYAEMFAESREDTTNRVPFKWVNVLPKSVMGGILGFTYLGDASITLRDDLVGEFAHMVKTHESIHTPDEYETRVLTDWILERSRVKYKR